MLDLAFEMLQATANGSARATTDHRPQERSLEPARAVDARSRHREEVEPGPVGTALVVDEKPELERRLEIVARPELLDRSRSRVVASVSKRFAFCLASQRDWPRSRTNADGSPSQKMSQRQ